MRHKNTKRERDTNEALNKLLAAATKDGSKEIIKAVRAYIHENRNKLKYCPMCTSPIHDVVESFTKETSYDVIRKIYNWSLGRPKPTFKSSDIKHLLDHTQYANLNHLIAFKGILYRPENPRTGRAFTSTFYGINRERARQFLEGHKMGPVKITRNRITRERIDVEELPAEQMPMVMDRMDEDGIYRAPHANV